MAASEQPSDGDWVSARPLGWRDGVPPSNVLLGAAQSGAPISGVLTIIESNVPGVKRHAVNGETVDPATLRKVGPPTS